MFFSGGSTPPCAALALARKLEIISSMVLKVGGLVLEFSLMRACSPRSEVSSLFVIVTFGRVSSCMNIS